MLRHNVHDSIEGISWFQMFSFIVEKVDLKRYIIHPPQDGGLKVFPLGQVLVPFHGKRS